MESSTHWGTNPPDPLGRFAPEPPPILLKKGVKHQLTHRTLICDFYLWEPANRPELPEGYFWIKEAELDHYGKPRLFELLIQEVEKTTL